MAAPLVSICIPTYQGAPWLAGCLESAAAQTLPEHEILVVDDASDDDTVAIAAAYADRDAKVTVHRHATRVGLVENWNRCLRLARGEWIKFLFQDDLLAPDCLAKMVTAGQAAGEPGQAAPLVICDRQVELSADTSPETAAYFAALPRMDDLFGPVTRVGGAEVCRALLANPGVNFFGEPSAILIHRSALDRGDYHKSMIQLCDLEFAARVASNVGLVRVREELATFRVHGRSASATNKSAQQFRKDVLDTLVLFHEYAFGAHFAALRQVARAQRPPVTLSAWAARELQRAQRDVRESGDESMRRALQSVIDAHPRLGRPLWQLWHRVRKQVKG